MPLHEVFKADLVPEYLSLWHKGDLGIFHHTDVPRNASDQGGHIDGAFARDHLLLMSKHVLTGEQRICFAMAYRYCNSGKLQRRRSARVCTTMASHLARNLRVGLWMETLLFLLLKGSFDIALHHEFWS